MGREVKCTEVGHDFTLRLGLFLSALGTGCLALDECFGRAGLREMR